jgi:sugar-specific transcriptional regulator TrmB
MAPLRYELACVVDFPHHMQTHLHAKLEKWGLSDLEAQVYLALFDNATSLGASAVAAAAGIPRLTAYPVLESLMEKGMVENGEGVGHVKQFAAISPAEAFPRLLAEEKERFSERELLAADLIKKIPLPKRSRDPLEARLIEVVRDPRVLADRWQKLEREAKREINALVKAPMILRTKDTVGNPAETESLRRGVRHRAIYESRALADEHITPFLKSWIEAGEEAREYRGSLPFKLALFDNEIAWLPLETSAKRHPVVSVFIRHPVLARGLRLLFDYLWNDSEPISVGCKRVARRKIQKRAAPSPSRPRKK